MIYFDNAATSFPKPPQVARAMAGTLEKLGANPGRSGHRLSLCAGRVVNACREEAALLLGMEQPERVIFTGSCTEALNLAILGTTPSRGRGALLPCGAQRPSCVPCIIWPKRDRFT